MYLFCNSCMKVKHEGAVMFYKCCSDHTDNKTFWQNVVRFTGVPVSFHNISISFHYFQIDDSNKAVSVTVGNLF